MTTKYIIGLSGTHGTGKSTILNGVADAGFTVDRSQLSRAAQAALGWDTLSRAGESVENMWALQNMILRMLSIRDERIVEAQTLTFVERTPADLWAYTQMWCRRLDVDVFTTPSAQHYRAECTRQMANYNAIMILPPHDDVPFVAEPNRADEIGRLQADHDITSFIIHQNEMRAYIIKNVGKLERIAEVVNYLTYARATLTKENS